MFYQIGSQESKKPLSVLLIDQIYISSLGTAKPITTQHSYLPAT